MAGKLRLPPLNTLRAFHAVARHGSLRRAADELMVSPQAVGQQIKLLEDTLQVTLFERRGRAIAPTEAAVLLSHFVDAGFDAFADGVRRVTAAGRRDRVVLNASPYFATRYLLPRLSAFRAILPDADLRLTTMVDLPDFASDEVDMAVQWGYGGWPGHETTLLVPDPKVICCTSAIGRDIRSAGDLTRFPLLDPVRSTRLWPDILRHLGVEGVDGDRSIGFDDAATMRRAALEGIGIGLVSVGDAEEDLRSGALVAPLGRDALAGMAAADIPGFHLIVPPAHLRLRAVAALHRWLCERDWQSEELAGAQRLGTRSAPTAATAPVASHDSPLPCGEGQGVRVGQRRPPRFGVPPSPEKPSPPTPLRKGEGEEASLDRDERTRLRDMPR